MLTSCSDDVIDSSAFLSGKEKTPIAVILNFDDKQLATRTLTRAANGAFETNDQLIAYFRHVKEVTPATDPVTYEVVKSGKTGAPDLARLVNFQAKANQSNIDNYSNPTALTLTCTDAQGLYWDDFSEGGKGDATDLRTEDSEGNPTHFLQSYYGYCYNGGTPSTALTENTGVLGWSVPYDQSTAASVKQSDLLWSGEQTPQAYKHWTSNQQSIEHGKITIPYSHAMSMFTVELIAHYGFTEPDAALNNAKVIINGVNRTCTANAPSLTISGETKGASDANQGKVNMYGAPKSTKTINEGGTDKQYPSRIFQAITVPHSELSVDGLLLNIEDVDGNKYELHLTEAMVSSWKADDSNCLGSDSKTTQPGYNYKITVTLDKQLINVETSLTNWITVSAEGNGEIILPEDDPSDASSIVINNDDGHGGIVNFSVEDKNKFTNGSSFDLFHMIESSASSTLSETPNTKFNSGARDTWTTYDGTKWTNNDELYWPNDHDKFYFRALAVYNGITSGNNEMSKTYPASLVAKQGVDLVWGTTPAHKGMLNGVEKNSYGEGDPINPRTGDVPIAFQHIMTKITVQLKTTDGTPSVYNNAVDIKDAKISISNLVNTGTVRIINGEIDGKSFDSSIGAITGFYPKQASYPDATTSKLDGYAVIPQSHINTTDASKEPVITIQLKDKDTDNDGVADAYGTTYKLKMKDCFETKSDGSPKLDSEGNLIPITSWAPGRHYTYTITLEKEKITFRAMIKDWEETTGSGNATLEWD